MKFLHFYFIITFFIFQGCSTQQADPQANTSHIETAETTSDTSTKPVTATDKNTEAFDNEFETEFAESEKTEVSDPLSGYNRSMTSFNDAFFTYALNPVSKAYAAIIPQPLRLGLSNFIHNIKYPVRLVNNLLQLKFQNISDETERFIVNSTVGLAGFMDPATHYMNIPVHDEDFGQTLGHYGAGSGFHLVLPFLGPSNARDTLGLFPDMYLSPLVNLKSYDQYRIPSNFAESIAVYAVEVTNKNSLRLGEYESLKKDALDLYPFLKDIYEQKRASEIAE
ncbi:MAG: ABC transporter [Sulfurovum sp.]|nr:MAG: ABC transporter [Sulfurovum sp.]